jgi:hypothetical protein
MENTTQQSENERRIRKSLRNLAGGFVLAGGAVYGVGAAGSITPPVGSPEAWRRVGVGLFAIAFLFGVAWIVAEGMPLWRWIGEVVPRFIVWARGFRVVSRENLDGLLANARITAQAEAQRDVQPLRREAEAEKERCAVLVAGSTSALQSHEREMAKLREELDVARAQRSTAEADRMRYYHQMKYGRVLMEDKASDTTAYAAMRQSLQELRASLDRLLTATDSMWGGMIALAKNVPSDSALSWLLWCFKNYPSVYSVNAMRAFQEVLGFSNSDPRPYLAAGIIAYHNWREWLLRLVAMMEKRPDDIPAYEEWQEAEQEFLSLLDGKLGADMLETTKTHINATLINAKRLRYPPPVPAAVPKGSATPMPSGRQAPGSRELTQP